MDRKAIAYTCIGIPLHVEDLLKICTYHQIQIVDGQNDLKELPFIQIFVRYLEKYHLTVQHVHINTNDIQMPTDLCICLWEQRTGTVDWTVIQEIIEQRKILLDQFFEEMGIPEAKLRPIKLYTLLLSTEARRIRNSF